MGSSKLISNRELFLITMMLHQSGVFWVLPYFIVKGNGAFGLLALVPGVVVGLLIILLCNIRNRQGLEREFFIGLNLSLGKPLGKLTGLLFLLCYLTFAVVFFSSFVELINGQLLPDTPRWILLVSVFLLTGWLSWNGLEDIARMVVFSAVLMVLMLVFLMAGNLPVFSVEHVLPVRLQDGGLFWNGVWHSIFAYSGLLILFMLGPAVNSQRKLTGQLTIATLLSTAMLVLWVVLGLGVFGNYHIEAIVWLPLELARMVQLGPFLERTEVLFSVAWMAIVLINGSLLVWCVSSGLHQLLERQKSRWLHGFVVVALAVCCALVKDLLRLLYAERMASILGLGLLPVILLLVFVATLRQRKKKEAQK